jgi:hypothetical protein
MALAAVLCAVVAWQAASGAVGLPEAAPSVSPPASPIEVAAATAALTVAATESATPDPTVASVATGTLPSAGSSPSASPSATIRITSAPTARSTPSPTPTNRPWSVDPALVQAKNDGRVTIDSSGGVVILATAPAAPAYPAAASLPTSWSGLIQEPPKTGRDDKGVAYSDKNFALFCGPGTATVVLYYWPASHAAVTTTAGSYIEPTYVGAGRFARTYWKAQDAGGYGRGMILYMADVEWPTPDRGLSWWAWPGVMKWTSHPSTYVENLVDALNWEASGHTRLNYFYVIVHTSTLTQAALLDHVHSDINMGVPVVIAARTSDGVNSLPSWKVKSKSSAGNHFVSVVGYNDTAGTYSVMDTCGVACNDRNVRSGVRTMSQAALYALTVAESDNDGIMW